MLLAFQSVSTVADNCNEALLLRAISTVSIGRKDGAVDLQHFQAASGSESTSFSCIVDPPHLVAHYRVEATEVLDKIYELVRNEHVNFLGSVTWAFEFEDQTPYIPGTSTVPGIALRETSSCLLNHAAAAEEIPAVARTIRGETPKQVSEAAPGIATMS
jgi:hypothetical protein